MFDRFSRLVLVLCLLTLTTTDLNAGGFLEVFNITGRTPSPVPNQVIGKVSRIRWDERCIPVRYQTNALLEDVPNPLGASQLNLDEAELTFRRAMETWNRIKTSYIDFRLDGRVTNSGPVGFDFINELSFLTPPNFGTIATSPSMSLMEDSQLSDGMDLDGDGDSDVASSLVQCADADGDGDIEFPEGFYVAGTILDNDIQFNTTNFRFTVGDGQVDTHRGSVDLLSIAVHELGHSQGLAHVLDNQISKWDGTGSTMFPFVNTGDPTSEKAQRTLASDDQAWSSFFYPEGSSHRGPGSLGRGDVAFRRVYGLISGTVTDGRTGLPVAGASIGARRAYSGQLEAAAFSGTSQYSIDLATGAPFLVSPEFNIIDGKFEIPVRFGFYDLVMEATDGFPITTASTGFTTFAGAFFGQQSFNEEFYSGVYEDAQEILPGFSWPLLGFPGYRNRGINFVTNNQVEVAPFGPLATYGFTDAAPGTYYAVALPREQILALDSGGGLDIKSGEFLTLPADSSLVPRFAEAFLATGSVEGESAVIDLGHPLARERGFVGQDNDFAPLYFRNPRSLGRHVLRGLGDGSIQELFLVLRLETRSPFPGASGLPLLIGVSNTQPLALRSFQSQDGRNWSRQEDADYLFKLVMTQR